MKHLAIVLLVVVAACAPKRVEEDRLAEEPKPDAGTTTAFTGSGSMNAAMLAAMQVQASMAQASSACDAQRKTELSAEEERALGNERAVRFIANHGPLIGDDRPQVTKELARIGFSLSRASSRPLLPWTFGVVESDKALSFGGGGGYVLVTTGLVKKCANEAQLAAVLAQEISRVLLKSDVEPYLKAQYTQCFANATLRANGLSDAANAQTSPSFMNMTASMMDQMANLPSPAREAELDGLSIAMLRAAGYAPEEYEALVTALGDEGHDGWRSEGRGVKRAAAYKAKREAGAHSAAGKKPPLPAALRF